MSDGENLEFDDFELPGDGETADVSDSSAEFANLDDLPEGPELSGIGLGESETVDEPQAVETSAVVDKAPADAQTPVASKRKIAIDLPTIGAFGASGLLLAGLAFADLQVLGQWPMLCVLALNGLGVIAAAIPFLLWAGRGSLNLYGILLSITLAAILVGCSLLLLELVKYEGDFTAKQGAIYAAPPSTTAVA